MMSQKILDESIGWWVKGVPYQISGGNTFETAKRTYVYPSVSVVPNEIIKASKCNTLASNYFQYTTPKPRVRGVQKGLLMEGRYYYHYLAANKKFQYIEPKSLTLDNLITDLYPVKEIWFELASLICVNLSKPIKELQTTEIINTLRSCNVLEEACSPCTIVGHKMATSLVKIAATRIFSEPAQSILELPVNSLDSYNPDAKVGKFGMGFFSILYWLIGHPNREMIIDSYYDVGAYTVIIKEVNGVLAFNLQTKPFSHVTLTGTRIVINSSKDQFTPKELSAFSSQLRKLRYVSNTSGKIYQLVTTQSNYTPNLINDRNRPDYAMQYDASPKDIICITQNNHIVVEDYGKGIPLSILFGSLFIPSISTKKIQLSTTTKSSYNVFIYSEGGWYNTLSILVGNIVVVELKYLSTVAKHHAHSFILSFSSNMRLPVSRDDILVDNDTKILVMDAVTELLELSLKYDGTTKGIQKLLNDYIAYTPNDMNKELVAVCLTSFFRKHASILVPKKYIQQYKALSKEFVGSNIYSMYEIEHFLFSHKTIKTHDDVWYGVHVVYISQTDPNFYINNMGLPNYLFVSNEYVKTVGKGWVDIVTHSYNKRVLQKYSSLVLLPTQYDEFTSEAVGYILTGVKGQFSIRTLSTKTQETLDTALSVLENANGRVFCYGIGQLTTVKINFYVLAHLTSDEEFLEILSAFIGWISTFHGNDTYGGRLATFNMIQLHQLFGLKIMLEKLGKSFFVEMIISSINATNTSGNIVMNLTITRTSTLHPINDIVIQNAKAYYEVAFFDYGYAEGIMSSKFANKFTKPAMKTFVKICLERIRAYPFYTAKGLSDYKKSGNEWVDLTTSKLYAQNYLETLFSSPEVIMKNVIIPPKPTTLNLTQLINAAFQHDIPPTNDITKSISFLHQARTYPKSLPLQIIEIAVNEGTVKPFIDASLTELIQNSIDIIRETKNTQPIVVEYGINETNDAVIFAIKDHVGMTSHAFTYIGIPFLSTKTPSEIVTGEMGSGFFNVYRESSKVVVKSVKDGIMRWCGDFPVRDDTGRVVDITKVFHYNKSNEENGTVISVVIPTKTKDAVAETLSNITSYLKNVIVLANIPVDIWINKMKANVPRVLLSKVGKYIEIYRIGYFDESLSQLPSYLLTKGIPLTPLSSIFHGLLSRECIDKISNGFLINIIHGGYTPVQTRTKVNMSEEIRAQLVEAGQRLCFLSCYFEFWSLPIANRDYLMANYNSIESVKQLKFTNYTVTPIMASRENYANYLCYYPYEGNKTIAAMLNDCITTLGDNQYVKYRERWPLTVYNDNVDKILKKYETFNDRLTISKICENWLVSKNTKIIPKTKVTTKTPSPPTKKKPKEVQESESLTKIFVVLVNTYWDIAQKAGIIGFATSVPKVLAYNTKDPDGGYAGRYLPDKHEIQFELGYQKDDDVNKFKELIHGESVDKLLNGMANTHMWQEFFSDATTTSTLPHELEHARGHELHSGSSHGLSTVSLFKGEVTKTRTFSQRVNEVWYKVKMNGFWEKVVAKLKEGYVVQVVDQNYEQKIAYDECYKRAIGKKLNKNDVIAKFQTYMPSGGLEYNSIVKFINMVADEGIILMVDEKLRNVTSNKLKEFYSKAPEIFAQMKPSTKNFVFGMTGLRV